MPSDDPGAERARPDQQGAERARPDQQGAERARPDRQGAEQTRPRGWAWTALLVLTGLAGTLGVRAPAARGADAPPEVFSAARAALHVEVIALDPHPAGSELNRLVLEYLIDVLEELGLEPEVQRGGVALMDRKTGVSTEASLVENLLVRLPARSGRDAGAESTGTVLFVCHYDARGAAPGAGDDGAAVAAFLEALRALRTEEPLRNELLFLFTDAEELGLLGAQLFADKHAALAEVDLVFNFEGRGNAGPAILFETGRNNGRVAREAARCLKVPVASSLGPTIYALMPNDTDFTVFKERGLPGLNFAWLGGASAYHSIYDTANNLDPRSLQHHGTNVLALARHFGELELTGLQEERDAAFFTLPGNLLVLYGGSWNWPLGALALAIAVAAVARGAAVGRLSPGGTLAGTVVTLVVLVLVTMAMPWVVESVSGLPGRWWSAELAGEPRGNWLSSRVTLHGIAALAAGLWALLLGRMGNRTRAGLAVGALIVWSTLVAALLVKLEGASTTFVWPLAFGALAVFAQSGKTGGGRGAAGIVAASSAAVLLLLGPTLDMNHQVWATAPAKAAQFSAALGVLTAVLLTPALGRVGRWRWALVLGGLALLATGGALGLAGR